MAAASKWRLIRSPRELRSSRMDYIQNIAIGTSARTKTSSSFFFFFFTFLVPLCIQKRGMMTFDTEGTTQAWSVCTWSSFFRNVLASLFVGFSTVSTAFVSELTRYLTTIQQSRTHRRGVRLFFFSILNHPRDFNALSVDGTFPIRVSSRVTLENTSMEDSFTFRGHFSFARWHANGEYEIFIFKNLNGQTAHSSTTRRVFQNVWKNEKKE